MNTFEIKTIANKTRTGQPSGTMSYFVTGWLSGKRIRERFKLQHEAVTRKQNLEREVLNLAPLPAITTRLTTEQAKECEGLYRRLDGHRLGLTMTQCVEFALDNYSPADKPTKVADAVDRFLLAKKAKNLRPHSLRNLSTRVGWLKTQHGQKLVSEIQLEQLRAIIHGDADNSPVTKDNNRRALSSFFTWAVNEKFCTANPMLAIESIETDRDEPAVLTLDEVRRLMAAALTFEHGKLVPYVTLALFCAIRPTEIQRLTWDNVNLKSKTITIGAKIAKMRGRRLVAISDNAVEFLLPHQLAKKPFVDVNWRKDFDALKALAGITWTPDVLRHTGISMHLEKHEHEGKTARWAGNSPDVIQQHYKGLVQPEDSAAFWNIEPDSAENPHLSASGCGK